MYSLLELLHHNSLMPSLTCWVSEHQFRFLLYSHAGRDKDTHVRGKLCWKSLWEYRRKPLIFLNVLGRSAWPLPILSENKWLFFHYNPIIFPLMFSFNYHCTLCSRWSHPASMWIAVLSVKVMTKSPTPVPISSLLYLVSEFIIKFIRGEI